MACASLAGQTYARELYSLQLGLPQWFPEDSGKPGDVGFFLGGIGGSFVKLHNILHSEDDQENGVPDNFTPLVLPERNTWKRHPRERDAQPLVSLEVKRMEINLGVSS